MVVHHRDRPFSFHWAIGTELHGSWDTRDPHGHTLIRAGIGPTVDRVLRLIPRTMILLLFLAAVTAMIPSILITGNDTPPPFPVAGDDMLLAADRQDALRY